MKKKKDSRSRFSSRRKVTKDAPPVPRKIRSPQVKVVPERVSRREFMRAYEVASLLGVSREHVLRMLREHKLPGIHMGRLWLVKRADLDAYLESLGNTDSLLAPPETFDAQPETTTHN